MRPVIFRGDNEEIDIRIARMVRIRTRLKEQTDFLAKRIRAVEDAARKEVEPEGRALIAELKRLGKVDDDFNPFDESLGHRLELPEKADVVYVADKRCGCVK